MHNDSVFLCGLVGVRAGEGRYLIIQSGNTSERLRGWHKAVDVQTCGGLAGLRH